MTDRVPDNDRAAAICFNAEKIDALRRELPDACDLELLAGRHKAIGHPRRLALLSLLALEDCCVCDLAHALQLPTSTVSQHLSRLRAAGLLRSRQEGKYVIYSLAQPLAELLTLRVPSLTVSS